MVRCNFMFVPFVLVIAITIWYSKELLYKSLMHPTKVIFLPSPEIVQRSAPENTVKQDPVVVKRHEKSRYLYYYQEPEIAGSGSYGDELRRFNLFMASQGVICQNIRHFGGRYMNFKEPPEYDPDGAWYLCLDPQVILSRTTCVVYSIGIDNEWSFDDAIAKYGCRVFAFDPTMNKSDYFRTLKIQFFNVGLSDIDSDGRPGATGRAGWKTRTLKTIIKERGHENRLIDVLKIDIEQDEWKCLPQMLADGSLRKYVKQLDIELHIINLTPNGIRRYYGIVQWLDRQGFKIANMHKNMYCPQCYEATFINTNLIDLPIR